MRVEIHGHRGARGLWPENTLPGMSRTMELGVHALELDVALTADRRLVLTHDLTVSAVTSADTRPVTPDDPAFPYVGKPINSLTLAQLRTLDVGVRFPRHPQDPFALTQVAMPETRMPTLGAVLGLVNAYQAAGVRLHIELKSDPTRPALSAAPEEFAELVLDELDRHGRLHNAAILSFDWRIISRVAELAPDVRRFALVELDTLGWNGPLGDDVPAAARAAGATTLSPEHVMVDERLMAQAAAAGLDVAVWTVNDTALGARMLDLGVSGIVTDYPDRMRELWRERGLELPEPVGPLKPVGV
ncbi:MULTISPECIES: glycerophosphodiester phosphodiesterase family protein [Nonomuraea]|uniref:Glycerophosphodiester phosphodiesterase family protein n=2 Tax=Nonomuraea TaxID=83681 RepID=A0ABW1C535_9ACTN|nr:MULTISPECIES: glycerophosphodiester phosphodiesterase family protein [Nonomuraea]MDA0644335.1 glycerophosphodiester phosphodiesterase family protein [Nonomuraea ferruginea]TXK35212.1 glycerophosphodiester phosphodiesterase [Nonomuraea sp. C10]